MVKVYGASDDLIEVEGSCNAEFSCYLDEGESRFLAFSDGTLLRVVYDDDGIWRLTRIYSGTAAFEKVEGSVEEDTMDIVTLTGDIKWVALASDYAK